MSPKRKSPGDTNAKAKKVAKAKPGASSAIAAEGAIQEPMDVSPAAVSLQTPLDEEMSKMAAVNAITWANFQKLVTTIKEHPAFDGIEMDEPPEISSGYTGAFKS